MKAFGNESWLTAGRWWVVSVAGWGVMITGIVGVDDVGLVEL